MNSDDFRGEEIDRLSKHSCFCFDAADAPSYDPETIDHGGVGISADKAVRVEEFPRSGLGMEDATGEVFQIDLMDNADSGRDDSKGFKCLLTPFEKLVPLAVALELHLEVQLHCIRPTVIVHLHGVIDDEVDRDKRFDDTSLAA